MDKMYHYITSSNGFSAVVFDDLLKRVKMFYPHIYKNYDKDTLVNNIAYDTYFGILIDGSGFWLPERDENYNKVGYITGTGIIHTERSIGNLTIEEFFYSPLSLNFSSMVMLIKIKIDYSIEKLSVYSIHNFHLGQKDGVTNNLKERIIYDTSDMFFETSESSNYIAGYKPVLSGTIHSTNPVNPYNALKSGSGLSSVEDSGVVDDAVCGFQKDFSSLKLGDEVWFGVLILYGDDKSDKDKMALKAKDYLKNYAPQDLLEQEKAEWGLFFDRLDSRFKEKANLDPILKNAAVLLKMAQVREENDTVRRPSGQILASIPPGMWNITWLRDMMYSIYALIAIGAEKEAFNALNFILNARTGDYREYVGTDYKFSVCRYYGDGVEESDSNEDGPNIEFDGPGLFLLGIELFIRKFGIEKITDRLPDIYNGFADVLLKLIDEEGLIKKDSSIWERHLNGKEKHFTYTQITAASGLCAAKKVADLQNDTANAGRYYAGYKTIFDNIHKKLVHRDGFLVSSLEEYINGTGYLDASVVEGINAGILKNDSDEALYTLNSFSNLKTGGGGYRRNDDGDWYDRQEWVFIDLRIADAFRKIGDEKSSNYLINRIKSIVELSNYQFPELIDEDGISVLGSIPMIGFGAGAYILANMNVDFSSCFSPISDGGEDVTDIDRDSVSSDILNSEDITDVASSDDAGISMDVYGLDDTAINILEDETGSCSCNMIR